MGVSAFNNEHRRKFQDCSRSLVIGTGEAPTTVGLDFITKRPGFTIFVQRIAVHVTTAAAQTITFQDDNGSPKVIAVLPASATIGDEHVLLEHEEGVPLTEGAALDLVGSAGVGCRVDVLAYRRLTGVVTAEQFRTA